MMIEQQIHPFLKWAGGKRRLLPQLQAFLPKDFDTIKKYAEPFLGGGAMYFYLAQRFPSLDFYLSDLNSDLVSVYNHVKYDCATLCNLLLGLEQEYYHCPDSSSKASFYYSVREKFNNTQQTIEASSYFIFLNKTCFNGLYRVNSRGNFNVPHGKYKKPAICDKETIYAASKLLQSAKIENLDFSMSGTVADSGTFVYLDPPYQKLTDSSFSSYTASGFDSLSQVKVASFFDSLSEKGAKAMLSNSSAPELSFLYSQYRIENIRAIRSINSNKNKRGQIDEILILNY